MTGAVKTFTVPVTDLPVEARGTLMTYLDVDRIDDWHAHVYFNAASRDAAWLLREAVTARFADEVEMGRFHERAVGPHPCWSYQIAFVPARFAEVVGWIALNHGALDVFIHPNTGDPLRDHRDCAIWLGRNHQLDLRAVGG
jgi:aromatic ring-cleaving dioxygenase